MTTTERPHGRTKYVVEKCKCDVCRAGARDYERNRTRQRAYGRVAYVEAEPARQHVQRLSRFGIGHKRLARLAGVADSTIWKLVYGDRTRFGRPSQRIRPETARKILAVAASFDNVADGAVIDATGTRRRLQALVAIGWSQSKLGQRLGILPTNMTGLMKTAQVQVATARAVRALYDELWQTPPAATEHRDKIAFSRSRRLAAARGWVPPLAWDDDDIDAPGAEPDGIADAARKPGRQGKLPPADELRWLLTQSSRQSIATRYGVRLDTIDQALRRSA